MSILSFIKTLFFPEGCAVCERAIFSPREAVRGLCDDCVAEIRPEKGICCPWCGRPLISERGVCVECREQGRPAFDRAIALHRYGGSARKLLRAYKFGTNRALSTFLASQIAGALLEFEDDVLSEAVIVPVPPRHGKMRKRGWDQVDLLAKCLATQGWQTLRCLKRLPSRTQKELDRRGRLSNLKGKILCTANPPPRIAILIDDVITTGATLTACAEALKSAGTAIVYALVLFYD